MGLRMESSSGPFASLRLRYSFCFSISAKVSARQRTTLSKGA
jgi:hypothetical protein